MLKYTENTYNLEVRKHAKTKTTISTFNCTLYAWLISMTKIELMALFLGYVFIFSNLNRIQEQSILEICIFRLV